MLQFVVREIRRVVKPGGYVEFRDLDPMLRKMGNKSSNIFERCEFILNYNKKNTNALYRSWLNERKTRSQCFLG
jgi:ubiquinone/menaquinone biosynthesis C-methylase UbiE